jgi:hypothetical protein
VIADPDEISLDRHSPVRTPSHQAELVKRYCASIDERIRTAPTKADGQRIIEEACAAFETECMSEFLNRALKDHANKILTSRWPEAG